MLLGGKKSCQKCGGTKIKCSDVSIAFRSEMEDVIAAKANYQDPPTNEKENKWSALVCLAKNLANRMDTHAGRDEDNYEARYSFMETKKRGASAHPSANPPPGFCAASPAAPPAAPSVAPSVAPPAMTSAPDPPVCEVFARAKSAAASTRLNIARSSENELEQQVVVEDQGTPSPMMYRSTRQSPFKQNPISPHKQSNVPLPPKLQPNHLIIGHESLRSNEPLEVRMSTVPPASNETKAIMQGLNYVGQMMNEMRNLARTSQEQLAMLAALQPQQCEMMLVLLRSLTEAPERKEKKKRAGDGEGIVNEESRDACDETASRIWNDEGIRKTEGAEGQAGKEGVDETEKEEMMAPQSGTATGLRTEEGPETESGVTQKKEMTNESGPEKKPRKPEAEIVKEGEEATMVPEPLEHHEKVEEKGEKEQGHKRKQPEADLSPVPTPKRCASFNGAIDCTGEDDQETSSPINKIVLEIQEQYNQHSDSAEAFCS
ncbi:hypothetical protein KEM55_005191 [Ascosphaera atra]|nr:hypothetical protein KEM55_005191 [Ascosphaera atra]